MLHDVEQNLVRRIVYNSSKLVVREERSSVFRPVQRLKLFLLSDF